VLDAPGGVDGQLRALDEQVGNEAGQVFEGLGGLVHRRQAKLAAQQGEGDVHRPAHVQAGHVHLAVGPLDKGLDPPQTLGDQSVAARVRPFEPIGVVDGLEQRLFDRAGLLRVVAEDHLAAQSAFDHHAADVRPHGGDIVVGDQLQGQSDLLEFELELLVRVQEMLSGGVTPGIGLNPQHDGDMVHAPVIPDTADVLLAPLDLVQHRGRNHAHDCTPRRQRQKGSRRQQNTVNPSTGTGLRWLPRPAMTSDRTFAPVTG